MPPDDSNSQGERRIDSHDEQSRENVTTAERMDISQKNAPSPEKEQVPWRRPYRAVEATFEETTEEELSGNDNPRE